MIPHVDLAAGCATDKLFASNGSQIGSQRPVDSKKPAPRGEEPGSRLL
jgi:hypothetical protein